MNWRHRCYGFDVFEIIFIEELDKLQRNHLFLNDFLSNITMMVWQLLYVQSRRKGIPFKVYCQQSPLSAVVCRLFQFLKLNITDLLQIDQEIENLTNLFLDEVPHSISPPVNRTIVAINKDSDCYYLTRFNKQQLQLLFIHLRIPPRFTVHKTHHFDGEFILLLSLTYLASAENMKSLAYKFGGNHDFWGGAFKEFIDHIYYTFYHKISGDSLRIYSKKKYQEFAGLVYDQVVISSKEQFEYDNNDRKELVELNIKKNEFRIPAFIDDTNVRACRVGSGAINGGGKYADRRDRSEQGNDLQKSFYR
jgi:hypothetical protein